MNRLPSNANIQRAAALVGWETPMFWYGGRGSGRGRLELIQASVIGGIMTRTNAPRIAFEPNKAATKPSLRRGR